MFLDKEQIKALEGLQDKYGDPHAIEDVAALQNMAAALITDLAMAETEILTRNAASAHALNAIWVDYVADGDVAKYGDWEYPGQVYRHVMAKAKGGK